MPIQLTTARCVRFAVAEGKYPVILSYGPYAKGLAFQEGYKSAWLRMQGGSGAAKAPATSTRTGSWSIPRNGCRTATPSCGSIRAAPAARPAISRCGRRARPRTSHECVEWAGTQPWSNGKVGINGISYYAMNQWHVAPLKPPHLAALCIWEGSSDYYRELCRHGGILCDFYSTGIRARSLACNTASASAGRRAPSPASRSPGRGTCPETQLAKNRADFDGDALRHRLIDDYYSARLPDFDHIDVPMLSAANWGGKGLHPRGNFEGYLARGLQAEMAGGARRHALLAFLRELRRRTCSGGSSAISSRARTPAGTSSRRCAQHPPSRREILAARRERMAARAHAMDQVLSAADDRELEPAAAARPRRR